MQVQAISDNFSAPKMTKRDLLEVSLSVLLWVMTLVCAIVYDGFIRSMLDGFLDIIISLNDGNMIRAALGYFSCVHPWLICTSKLISFAKSKMGTELTESGA